MRRFLFLSSLLAAVVTALALLAPFSTEDVRDLGPEAIFGFNSLHLNLFERP